MAKVVVKETVTNSVELDTRQVNIERDTIRCFQLLEEERWDEAHNIIETILNIDPNNTDAHVANFLYQFKLTCSEDVVQNFKNFGAYKDSVFYKRVKRGEQTELAKQLDFGLRQASEQLEKFNIEQERIRKEKEQRQEILFKEKMWKAHNRDLIIARFFMVLFLFFSVVCCCGVAIAVVELRPGEALISLICAIIFGFPFLLLARDVRAELKWKQENRRQR